MINSGDTAWVLASGALVLFMTPGLAIFYGGMVRAKSVLNMMMMSFGAMGVTTIIWVLYGYSLTFGKSHGGLIGGFENVGLAKTLDQVVGPEGHQIPMLAFAMFQLTFAIITVALLSGAIADRAKYASWVLFVAVWITLVYIPVAHWAFAAQGGTGGWIVDTLGALDFAGGTVVEINSGAAALALALVLGKRDGFRRDPMRPHNMPLVLLGAGMLWFGWFGFNAGSALSAGSLAATAMINTQIASAAASMSWVLFEKRRDGKATTLGVASGAIAGAVVITPACGFVNPLGALLLGLLAGVAGSYAVSRKYKFGYDDSLDVVGVHGVSGIIGMIGIGLLATVSVNSAGKDGLFSGGGTDLLVRQLIAIVVVALFSFCATWIIATVISKTIGFRATHDDEIGGLDTVYHAESAYDITGNSNRY
ncbi:MAG: ammonium transporter [Streptomycetaceae bacterium]|nr:MAG: ammonium transporter [Streptomycetaceae bacterium]